MIETRSKQKTFGGSTNFYSHHSQVTGTEMRFSAFLPSKPGRVPVLYWLSGLTCSEENFMAKSGAQRLAEELGLAIVCPDTSPRNTGIADEAKDWECGTAASYYVDATQSPWSRHYKMESYLLNEFIPMVEKELPLVADARSISGHSVGGHGALVLALRNPKLFRSISAFAPMVAPTECPWGKKAFTTFLGSDTKSWERWDAHLLVRSAATKTPLLIDQGSEDKFLKDQLMTPRLEAACKEANYPLLMNYRSGYDHSYYYVASFIGEHLRYHAEHLIT